MRKLQKCSCHEKGEDIELLPLFLLLEVKWSQARHRISLEKKDFKVFKTCMQISFSLLVMTFCVS